MSVALSSGSHELYLKYLLKKQGKEGWGRLIHRGSAHFLLPRTTFDKERHGSSHWLSNLLRVTQL